MRKIRHIKAVYKDIQLGNFVEEVNTDIDELNKIINAYNKSKAKDKISALEEIIKYKQYIESKYSDTLKNKCPAFSDRIHKKLFLSINKQIAIYRKKHIYIDSAPTTNTFSKLLADMQPKTVEKLIAILAKGKAYDRDKLRALYAPDKNTEFENFLKHNEISFLGGQNSKNFKITPKDGSVPYVLKLENRLGMPKQAVNSLRDNALKKQLTSVMSEREMTVKLDEKLQTLSVLTTEFCPNGNLLAHSARHIENTEKHIYNAINIYLEMLNILIDIGTPPKPCAFPDMKNTNWLIGENNQLTIADTKSFIFCESDGTIDPEKSTERTCGTFLFAQHVFPPEYIQFKDGKPISADKMHVYMCGKNLYQYLTGLNSVSLFLHDEISDFSQPIFQTDKGKILRPLIESMVTRDPEKRLSLAEAKERLFPLIEDLKKLKKEALKLLKEIKGYEIGKQDGEMRKFFEQQTTKINQASDPQTLQAIRIELNKILKEQTDTRYVQKLIIKYRTKSRMFTLGMLDKANRIEKAMRNIPVTDRGKLAETQNELVLEVHKAIASHRYLPFFKKPKPKGDEIDENLAANAYKNFKKQIGKEEDDDDEKSFSFRR